MTLTPTLESIPAGEGSQGCIGVWTFLALQGQNGVGKFAFVDADIYPALAERNWFYNRARDTVYRNESIGDQRTRKVSLHREVLGVTDPTVEVDHINRDRLDNRRCNLRAATRQQNAENMVSHRDARSKYRGVDFHKQTGKWRARACINYETVNLGLFETEEAAADAARAFRAEHMPFATD